MNIFSRFLSTFEYSGQLLVLYLDELNWVLDITECQRMDFLYSFIHWQITENMSNILLQDQKWQVVLDKSERI